MNDPHIILPLARLVADPERRQTKNGAEYCIIRVAANGCHRDKHTGQWVDHVSMFFTIFEYDQRRMDSYMQSLHKGTPVRVEGDLKTSEGTDRNGQTRTGFTIPYATITMVVPKADQQQTTPQHQSDNWGNTNQPDPYAQFSNDDEW